MESNAIFRFSRDTFAFSNELVWEYKFDSGTGDVQMYRRTPRPVYCHRCFVMVRAARQFFYGAVFDHRKPALDAKSYYRLVRRVVSRSPRQFDPASILIPGFDGLKSFSAAFEETVKSACGGAWRSYFLRSHWRIVWPFSRAHQYRTAENLSASLSKGKLPIVHLIDFPRLNINHGLLLFDEGRDENGRKKFTAYDPNQMTNPAELIFDPKTSTFSFLPCRYWRGGRLNAFEIYYNHIY